MKKIVLICLAVMMILSVGSVVFAADGFVSSPSKTGAPELISAENASKDCTSKLYITAYSDRDRLPAEKVEIFKYAYDMILGKTESNDFAVLMDRIAEEQDIDRNDLVVSDFFDISRSECLNHENHTDDFNIVLKATALDDFVYLLHYENGSWNIVEDAKVSHDNTYLEFVEDGFSPFAIVVNVGEKEVEYPNREEDQSIVVWVVVGVVSSGAAGYGIYRYISMRKNKI